MADGSSFIVGGTESALSKHTAMTQYWTIQGYTSYEKKLKEHTFRVQVGAQAEENSYRKISGTGKELFLPDLASIAIAQGDRTFSDDISDWATVGAFGRLNYNFSERYLVELSGRYDGSGRYGEGSRWGFFPSASAGWILSKESFFEKATSVVNHAKIRASYGTLGNQGNSAGYLHIPTMTVGAQTPWIFDGVRLPYVNTPGILNMQRTWEKITTLDVALELNFLDNRLTSEFGYFKRVSSDIIGPPTPKAAVLGTSAPQVNNAAFVTKGFEIQMAWRDLITPDWSYSVGLSLSDGMSEITEYNTATNTISGWRVGKKFGEIWGYESDRFLTEADFNDDGKLKVSQDKIHTIWHPGDVKYKDIDGDGIISPGNSTVEDPGDQTIIGNSTARYRYGINLATGYDFKQYGKVDISIFMEGIGKRDVFMGNSYYFFGTQGTGWESSHSKSIYEGGHLDFYRDETTDPRLLDHLGMNIDSYFPRPYDSNEGAKNFKTSTKYLLNGAYLRLKNLQVSYTLPEAWMKKVGGNSCRVYFSGENLFVLSALPTYLDPEMVGGGRMYPQQAVYSFGVNIGF
jgi:TonB-linked SusC/RagA family outer membrane protein